MADEQNPKPNESNETANVNQDEADIEKLFNNTTDQSQPPPPEEKSEVHSESSVPINNISLIENKLGEKESKISSNLSSYGSSGLEASDLPDLLSDVLFITDLTVTLADPGDLDNTQAENIAFETFSNFVLLHLFGNKGDSESGNQREVITYSKLQGVILEFANISTEIYILQRDIYKTLDNNTPIELDPFLLNIDKSILEYEVLAEKLKTERKNSNFPIDQLINTLKSQKNSYLHRNPVTDDRKKINRNSSMNPTEMTLEERWVAGIKEIFYFYAQQHNMVGKKPTFDQMETTKNIMYIGSYMKFTKDFAIPLNLSKLKSIFKRYAHLSKDMKIHDFQACIKKMSEEIVKEKIEEADAKLRLLAPTFKVGDEELMQGPPPEVHNKEGKGKSTEIENLKKEIKIEENKSSEEKLTEFYNFLECGDLSKYRNKIKGFTLPFNCKDKNYRIPRDDSSRRYRFKSEKTADEIKKDVQILKERRLEDKKRKEGEEKDKYEKNRMILRRMHEKQKKLRSEKVGMEDGGKVIVRGLRDEREVPIIAINKQRKYADMGYKHGPLFNNHKITLQSLEKLTYNDINQNSYEDEFRPADFLNDSDDEDLDILKKYKKGDPSSDKKNALGNKRIGGKYHSRKVSDIIQKIPEAHPRHYEKQQYSKKKVANKPILSKPQAPTYKQVREPDTILNPAGYGGGHASPSYMEGGYGGVSPIYAGPQYGGISPNYSPPAQGGYHPLNKSMDYNAGYYSGQDMTPMPNYSPKAGIGTKGQGIKGKGDFSYEILNRAKEVDILESKKKEMKYNKILMMHDRNQQRAIKSLPRK